MSANETGEWIFSDEYHEWQDKESSYDTASTVAVQYREYGNSFERKGWYVGLFDVKGNGQGDTAARWPKPYSFDDLDLVTGHHPGSRP